MSPGALVLQWLLHLCCPSLFNPIPRAMFVSPTAERARPPLLLHCIPMTFKNIQLSFQIRVLRLLRIKLVPFPFSILHTASAAGCRRHPSLFLCSKSCQSFSKCGPRISSISIPWEFVRSSNPWAPPHTLWTRNCGQVGPVTLGLNKPSG